MSKVVESVVVTNAGAINERETLEVRVFPENVEPSKVTASYQVPVELSQYNRVQCFCSVSLPCYEEEANEKADEAIELAGKKAGEMADRVREKRDG